ncbi:uncharacterized protein LOC142229020 isoform X2 [Haematobia irritans]|uniref:uncharacterized protein LOC142229020 isoform X2 n=1 Tax=Haematobia irritans TaxID=7368 RepID=UPI003F4F9F06
MGFRSFNNSRTSSINCSRYLNHKCQNCSIWKKLCRKIIKDYCRKQCRENYSIFNGGNSINIRIRRSSAKGTKEIQDNCCPCVRDPCDTKSWEHTFTPKCNRDTERDMVKITEYEKLAMKNKRNSNNKDQSKSNHGKSHLKTVRRDETQIYSQNDRNAQKDFQMGGMKRKTKSKNSDRLDPNIRLSERNSTGIGTEKHKTSNQDPGESQQPKEKRKRKSMDFRGNSQRRDSQQPKRKRKSMDSNRNSQQHGGEITEPSKSKRNKSEDMVSNEIEKIIKTRQNNKPGGESKKTRDQIVSIPKNNSNKDNIRRKSQPLDKHAMKDKGKFSKQNLLRNSIITDLRWKVRNGKEIHAITKVPSPKIGPQKEENNVYPSKIIKPSRFDEKPWDILRAAMEQRELSVLNCKPTCVACPCYPPICPNPCFCPN